ncbi:hypothetical protein [Xylanibacter ruminicola]|uniref:Uncharacterized protein n=1 Tax=Xylanibacter ruminicola TaxID=839 RepID=A0A1M6UYH6_XYLRU|nr:hypothetical protein [Xylanibacter ruminicola]SHK74106.1 hypothetical protein SAMN05216463_1119 [Xylanibacter ruminicola]
MTTKKKYEKPSMQVFELKQQQQLLAGSNGGLKGQNYEKSNYDPFEDE